MIAFISALFCDCCALASAPNSWWTCLICADFCDAWRLATCLLYSLGSIIGVCSMNCWNVFIFRNTFHIVILPISLYLLLLVVRSPYTKTQHHQFWETLQFVLSILSFFVSGKLLGTSFQCRRAFATIKQFVIKIDKNIKRRIRAILSASWLFLPAFSPKDFAINLQRLLCFIYQILWVVWLDSNPFYTPKRIHHSLDCCLPEHKLKCIRRRQNELLQPNLCIERWCPRQKLLSYKCTF